MKQICKNLSAEILLKTPDYMHAKPRTLERHVTNGSTYAVMAAGGIVSFSCLFINNLRIK